MQETIEGFSLNDLYTGFIALSKFVGGIAAIVKGAQYIISCLQQSREYFKESSEDELVRLANELESDRSERDVHRKKRFPFGKVSVKEELLQARIEKIKVRIGELKEEIGIDNSTIRTIL